MERLKRTSLYIFFGLLAYMPLHIFLSTWIGTGLHVLEFAKIAKDIALFIGFVLIFAVSLRQKWFKQFMTDKLTLLIAAYALVTILLALYRTKTDQAAEILGIVYNLRFLLFLLYGILLTKFYKQEWLRSWALRVVLAVSLPVMVFGAVQYLWLPTDALAHVGYSRENGVLPAFFIDDKPDLERAMSTLRDPNSYGSYLLIILAIALVYRLRAKNKHLQNVLDGLIILGVANLYFTFSRGAWLGLIVLVVTALALLAKQRYKISLRLVALPLAALILIAGGTLYALRDSYWVKNVILHADESTVLEDPNELRIRFARESLQKSMQKPLGHGPGTAGLVSLRDDNQKSVLTENYYLQVLYEVGIIGLILFMAILIVVGIRLYTHISHPAVMAIFVAFVALGFTNLLVHIWSNETVAHTWWGLVGILIYNKTTYVKKS